MIVTRTPFRVTLGGGGTDLPSYYEKHGGTHKTALIQRWLAKRPRYHGRFTPTGAFWLGLADRWFAEITTHQVRRGVHRSTRKLEAAI